MALKTPEQYKAALKKLKPNIYKFGELIQDVTTNPNTKGTVEGHAQLFAAALNPEYADLFTATSILSGEKVSRYLAVNQSADDMIANVKMKRTAYRLTGTCTGGRCAGYNAINSMWATTYDMDQELGTDYQERLKKWLRYAQDNDITISGALTDPKGNRSLPPSQQEDLDMNLHVVEVRDDGIVVRGAKIMICGIAAAQEVFILPGAGYREPDKDFAISFVIPKDIEGLTIVETRHPSDTREAEEGFDIPVKKGGITQAFLFFQDVFVPRERVFMCGEFKFAGEAVMNFIMPYRSAIGGCVAGQGDLMAGAAALIARANGLSTRVFNERLIQMYMNNETTFGMGVAASALGKKHPSGAWLCDPLTANVNKVYVGTLPYDTKVIAQNIGGGIAETGCMPSYRDFTDPNYGHLVQKYLKAASSAESRVKIARLIEWLTLGAGVPGCMHGGGSPEGAKLLIRLNSGLEKSVEYAKRLIDLQEDIQEPPKKK
ncbi:MAG: 4-hydroxyphenylacetate 3-hydroxylase N-terminal domain-containing protein [Chloroflexota bacterium]|nr:4-hydroxyphenylacetate 3-hydroxylase N-terminal domain-containing protein [Chloroflexota bacterium]